MGEEGKEGDRERLRPTVQECVCVALCRSRRCQIQETNQRTLDEF